MQRADGRRRHLVARLLASLDELDEARAQLVDSGQTYLLPGTTSSLRALLCERALDLALMAGDLDDALRWERSFTNSSQRPLPTALEVRLATARGSNDLSAVVDRALSAKQAVPNQIDTLLGAAAAAWPGDDLLSIQRVARATWLAEPAGLVRRLRDAGPVVEGALKALAGRPPDMTCTPTASPLFLNKLTASERPPRGGRRSTRPSPVLVEPLTSRELQVLELLIDGRSYSEIGVHLFVSRNTVKSHASHICTKLGVSGRRRALEAAHQLGLV